MKDNLMGTFVTVALVILFSAISAAIAGYLAQKRGKESGIQIGTQAGVQEERERQSKLVAGAEEQARQIRIEAMN
jgi:hypothetical protein